jgi:hypothetical protein
MFNKLFSTALIFTVTLFAFNALTMAQDFQLQPEVPEIKEVTDEELKRLVKVNNKIMPIQRALQAEQIEAVEDAGMEVERFSQLANAMQQGASSDDMNASEREMETFGEVMQEIMKLENEANDKIIGVIEDNDFEIERFQQIFTALQTDPELQEKFMQYQQELNDEI